MIFIYVHNPIFVTYIINHVVVFEIRMAATMMIAVAWDVIPYNVEHAASITRVDSSALMVRQQVAFEMENSFWHTVLCHPRRQQFSNMSLCLVWLLLAKCSVLATVLKTVASGMYYLNT